MTIKIPKDHPRKLSLVEREKIVEGGREGLLAPVALIAHGRGETFDYLIGEKTTRAARKAIEIAALMLLSAKHPVISVNGNTAVLAQKELWQLARAIPCPLEINIFYRTEERMSKLLEFLKNDDIKLLGKNATAKIPGLSSERAKCTFEGIFKADVLLVPLEDGDRCKALRKMGKTVIAIDLNPFSRTARTASLTIVDNITRCLKLLKEKILFIKKNNKEKSYGKIPQFNNKNILNEAILAIEERLTEFKLDPLLPIQK